MLGLATPGADRLRPPRWRGRRIRPTLGKWHPQRSQNDPFREQVTLSPDARAASRVQVREIFDIPEDLDINLSFDCAEPLSGAPMTLNGSEAFDAAVFCAGIAAAKRRKAAAAAAAAEGRLATPILSRSPEAEGEEDSLGATSKQHGTC